MKSIHKRLTAFLDILRARPEGLKKGLLHAGASCRSRLFYTLCW